jgi:hypothetical protein
MVPRIYTYKITFEEVPYWYWGVHKEKKYGELYLGSPVTQRWAWEFYTPKIQILEFFPNTEEGWKEANLVEDRLILPDLDKPLCLNEACGPKSSLKIRSKAGKIGGAVVKEKKVGVCGRTKEKMSEDGRKAGKVGGASNARNKTGFCGRSPEVMSEQGKKYGGIGGNMNVLNKTGICSLTSEQLSEQGRKAASQVWESTVDGFISNAGGVARHNKSLGHDPAARIRIS